MPITMPTIMPLPRPTRRRRDRALLALPLLAVLGACAATAGGGPVNRSLNSVHQPVVDRTTYSMDLPAEPGGLAYEDRQLLDAFLGALNAGADDTLTLDGAVAGAAAAQIGAVGARHGVVLDSRPLATGTVPTGSLRVTLTRSRAHVPGCPDWADATASQLDNRTSNNFGCGVNGNIAAMVADPQDLLRGRDDTGTTQVMTSNRGIDAWRKRVPGAAGELPRTASASGVSGGGQ